MKCEICNASMSLFESDCFDDLCSDCHDKMLKELEDAKEKESYQFKACGKDE